MKLIKKYLEVIKSTLKQPKKLILVGVAFVLLVSTMLAIVLTETTDELAQIPHTVEVTQPSPQMLSAHSLSISQVNELKQDVKNQADQLNAVKVTLQHLEQGQQQNVALMNQSSSQLNDKLESLQHAGVSNNKLLANIGSKLKLILNQLKYEKKAKLTSRYLNAKKLPFQLLSVELLNGVTYGVVSLDNHTHLIMQGECFSGWCAKQVRYDNQRVEFENKHHQLIVVSLKA